MPSSSQTAHRNVIALDVAVLHPADRASLRAPAAPAMSSKLSTDPTFGEIVRDVVGL